MIFPNYNLLERSSKDVLLLELKSHSMDANGVFLIENTEFLLRGNKLHSYNLLKIKV